MFRLFTTVQDRHDLQGKLSRGEFYQEPVAEGLRKAVLLAESDVRTFAPVDEGLLRASVTHRFAPDPVPLWGEVGTNVPYAEPLDRPRTRTPHYRAGPRRGQLTAGWLTGVLERQRAAILRCLDEAKTEIERRWRR